MNKFFSKFLACIATSLIFNVFSSSTHASYKNKPLKIEDSSKSSILRDDFEDNNDNGLFSTHRCEKKITLPNDEILSYIFSTKIIKDRTYIIETIRNTSSDNVVEENAYNSFDFKEFSYCFDRGKLNINDLVKLSELAYTTFKLQYIERQPSKFFVNNFSEYRNMEYLRIFSESLTGFLNDGIFCDKVIENRNMKSFFEIMIIINCALDNDFNSGILNFNHYNNLKNLLLSSNLSERDIFEKISMSLKCIKEYMDISCGLSSAYAMDTLIMDLLSYI